MDVDFPSSCHLLWPESGRQTLHMCSGIAQSLYELASNTACRLAKRYICRSNAFLADVSRRESSIRTHPGPPNVTYVTIFAFPLNVHETLHTQWFLLISSTWLDMCCANVAVATVPLTVLFKSELDLTLKYTKQQQA